MHESVGLASALKKYTKQQRKNDFTSYSGDKVDDDNINP